MGDRINYTLPSGFDIEFLPGEKRLEQNFMEVMQTVFEKYGFTPLETPAVERLEVLQAKGNQGDNILYAIAPITQEVPEKEESRALKFDQTVPLAAYIARHFHQLSFPFARYQMDMVFRGERAKTGRYRQFRQCDIDVVGRGELSLLYDAQIPAIIYEIFQKLQIGEFLIRINNRKILTGFFSSLGIAPDQIKTCIKVIDTLDKVGASTVKSELQQIGLTNASAKKIMEFISIKGEQDAVLQQLNQKLSNTNETLDLGIQELSEVVKYVRSLGVPDHKFTIDLSIARGLDYYTGTVYETTLVGYESLGSICSGGRYAELVGIFVGEKLPGVGISIGLTRLLKKLLDNNLVKPLAASPAQVMVVNMQADLMPTYLTISQKLRQHNIKVLTNFTTRPLKKQLDQANKLGIPLCLIIGASEQENQICSLKNMLTGGQLNIKLSELIPTVEQCLAAMENR